MEKHDVMDTGKQVFQTTFVPVPSLDIFEGDSVQVCVTDEIGFEQRSSFQFTDNSEIVVDIPPSLTLFTSPELYVHCAIELTVLEEETLADGTKTFVEKGIEKDDKEIVPSSNLISTLFSDITCKLNNLVVTSKSSLYPYLGFFLQNHLTKTEEYPLLEAQSLAYRYEEINSPDGSKATNGNYQKATRVRLSRKKIVNISGRIYLPIFMQKKLLLNNVGITLIFSQTSSEFRVVDLKDGRKAKLSIKDLWVSGKRVQLNDRLLIEMMNQLRTENAIYPIHRWVIDESSIPKGQSHFNKTLSLTTSQVPDYVFLMTFETEAVRGSYKKSPFESKVCRTIKSAQIKIENKMFPSKPFAPHPETNGTIEAFSEYKSVIKQLLGEHNWLDFSNYSNDYGVLAFKLSRSEEEDYYTASLPRGGVATLDVIYDSELDYAQTIVLIYCYRNKIIFNSSMIPATDY